VIILGDLHGDWGTLKKILNTTEDETIIQCGDFGFWPNTGEWKRFSNYLKYHPLSPKKIYWCDGNHEHFEYIKRLKLDKDGKCQILPGLFYMSRGSVLKIEDKVILFCGGASSIDRQWRTAGRDWFPEEVVSEYFLSDLIKIIDRRLCGFKVDMLISHTCPYEINMVLEDDLIDPTRFVLNELCKRYSPKRLYFAHWHVHKVGCLNNTEWVCLNHSKNFDIGFKVVLTKEKSA